ncbi:hypothetical protein [Dyella japonica]|uniref:Uncharacterized protein n=1 Tax=Dyella japonica DSM 16301 TaxID=1440762 RepID=A0A0G9H985_9GAMM|nr:hypothetical protein [Dyella japonica]KLD66041.1 hypothetical protein Y882_01180 [Dyella japonica DSM 16301]
MPATQVIASSDTMASRRNSRRWRSVNPEVGLENLNMGKSGVRELQELSAHRAVTLAKSAEKTFYIQLVMTASWGRGNAEMMARKDVGSVTYVLHFTGASQRKTPPVRAGFCPTAR